MDFVVGLPTTRSKKDAIWVIVDRLTKTAHFLPIKMRGQHGFNFEKMAELYVKEIVRLSEYQWILFQIGIRNSPRNSGRPCRMLWEQT